MDVLGIKNVKVIEGDGGEGYAAGAPYDRAIFTAGAYDLPHPFFEQIKEGGLFLVVIKNEGGGDTLFLLRKEHEYFESMDSMPCGFVQMRGKYQLDSLKAYSDSKRCQNGMNSRTSQSAQDPSGGEARESRIFPGEHWVFVLSSVSRNHPSALLKQRAVSMYENNTILGCGIRSKSRWSSRRMICCFPMVTPLLRNV